MRLHSGNRRARNAALKERVPLAPHVHYKIGGPARYFCVARSIEALRALLKAARRRTKNIFILGSGTNLLVPDKGFAGAVIKLEIKFIRVRGTSIEVGAGVLVSELLDYAARRGLSGLEWAGGLPGTVGGAIRGNAGCFGGETKDVVKSVSTVSIRSGRARRWSRAECRFGYRTSVFKKRDGKEAIVSAVFAMKKGARAAIRNATHEKIAYRRARHPLEYPNVGSIFKNVPVTMFSKRAFAGLAGVVKRDPFPVVPTAFLLSECGLKGARRGGAMISPKHPNFIVNTSHASSRDVAFLIARAKRAVKRKFGVTIEEEVMRL